MCAGVHARIPDQRKSEHDLRLQVDHPKTVPRMLLKWTVYRFVRGRVALLIEGARRLKE